MKYVVFKKLTIKNFLSVGPTPVEVNFKKGLHIITGINKDKEDRRNGVGKSTIADAIYFAVFGNTLRELKKDFIINNKVARGCQVVLELEIKNKNNVDKIKIARQIGPTKCFLDINGEDKTRDSMPNTTSAILDMLACTPDIFQNCVIMTVNNTTPFMAKKKVEKRKFIEGIFNLQIFGDMLLTVRQDINTEKQSHQIARARFDEVEKTEKVLVDQQVEISDQRKKRELKLKGRKKSNKSEIKEISQSIKQIEHICINDIEGQILANEENIEKCDTSLDEFNKDTATIEANINHRHSEHGKIGTSDDVCPTCLRTITHTDKGRIEDRKVTIDKEIADLKLNVTKLNKKISNYSQLKKKLKEDNVNRQKDIIKSKDVDAQKRRVGELKTWNDEIDNDLNGAEDTTSSFNKSIDQIRQKTEDIKLELARISNQIEVLETVKFIVSEEGVKSYIVKKILNLFNSKLAYYLKKMDANCQCTFNEYFEEEIISEKGKLCSYFNFSGAERKNIDLACLFAFMDIRRMQGDVAYNLSVYDELFDSSLDERGVELVLELLKERVDKYDECIMVISHRKESIKAATGDIIFLEKENGITRRVDYN